MSKFFTHINFKYDPNFNNLDLSLCVEMLERERERERERDSRISIHA
jgi:hypothetical protein